MFRITIRSIDQTKADAVRVAKRLASKMAAPDDPAFVRTALELAGILAPIAFDPMGYFLNHATYLGYKDEPVAWFWKHRNSECVRLGSQAELDAARAMDVLANAPGSGCGIERMCESLRQIITGAIKEETHGCVAEYPSSPARRWVFRLLTEIAYPGPPPVACYTAPCIRLCASSVLILENWRDFFAAIPVAGEQRTRGSGSRSLYWHITDLNHDATMRTFVAEDPGLYMALGSPGEDHQKALSAYLEAVDDFIEHRCQEAWTVIQRYAERVVTAPGTRAAISKLAGGCADPRLRGLVMGGCEDERKAVAELLAALTWRKSARWVRWSPSEIDNLGASLAREVLKVRQKPSHSGRILRKLRGRTLIALELRSWGRVSLNALKSLLDFLSETKQTSRSSLAVIGTCSWRDSRLHGVDNALLADARSYHILIPPLYLHPEDAKRHATNYIRQIQEKRERLVDWEASALDQLCKWPGLISLKTLRELIDRIVGRLVTGEVSVTKNHVEGAISEFGLACRDPNDAGRLCPKELDALRSLAQGSFMSADALAEKIDISRTTFFNKYAKSLASKDLISARQGKGYYITQRGMEYLNQVDQQRLNLVDP